MWKTNVSFHKQYLLDLFLSRNAKNADTVQNLLQTFLAALKRNVWQTFKSSSCKNVILKCVYHWYNLLWRMFFVPHDNWKTLCFIQISRYADRGLIQLPCYCVIWDKCFERSPHFIYVISTITLQRCWYQRSKIKVLLLKCS